jgi:ADP-ribose pyrophosphatase YjhB (NUDIX family)
LPNPELRAHIEALERAIDDPRHGLPNEVFRFVSRLTPLVNVDLLIQDQGRTLLTWRDDEFYGPGWHVPGGIIRFKESTNHRLRACAREELGAAIEPDTEPLLVSEMISTGDSRGHFVSLLFRCHVISPLDEVRRAVSKSPSPGQWQWHRTCPPNLLEEQRHYARFF